MPDIFVANTESAYAAGRSSALRHRWPLAGRVLNDELRAQLGMADDATPNGIRFAGLSEQYAITPNGYLIPFYPPNREKMDRSTLAERTEELMIDRAHSFINNAQPELGVLRTKEQIDADINIFENMPEDTHEQIAEKVARFKIVAGSIMVRLEMLGRMIHQRNTEGAKTEYNALTGKPVRDGKDVFYLVGDKNDGHAVVVQKKRAPKKQRPVILSDPQVQRLQDEARRYAGFLLNPELTPYMRGILLTDKKIDRDGLLIDLVSETAKSFTIRSDSTEKMVRSNMVDKIGQSMDSIDQIHTILRDAMTKQPTAGLFERSIQRFIEERGEDYNLHDVRDVVARLDEFAYLCRARACVRSDDPAYTEIFQRKSVLTGLFNGENGLLQSMKRVGNSTDIEIREMRGLLTRGVKLMERTAYTRMACNAQAPRIWVPQFDSNQPVEQYLIKQFLSPEERSRSQKVFNAAHHLPAEDRDKFLRNKFCSVGRLEDDFELLRTKIRTNEHDVPRQRGGR